MNTPPTCRRTDSRAWFSVCSLGSSLYNLKQGTNPCKYLHPCFQPSLWPWSCYGSTESSGCALQHVYYCQRFSAHGWLVLATWFSILAPFSWYIIFKAHSFIHMHMNFIVWQMPFAWSSWEGWQVAAIPHPTRTASWPIFLSLHRNYQDGKEESKYGHYDAECDWKRPKHKPDVMMPLCYLDGPEQIICS